MVSIARFLRVVMAGLDPGHPSQKSGLYRSVMDARVKPGHDESSFGQALTIPSILSIAFAKPSFSLLSVTYLAYCLTSSLALPIANEKPLALNMATSLCMSPMVATA